MNGIKPFEVEVDRTSCEVHAKGEAFKLTLKGVMLWKPLICKMANAAKGERTWLEGGVRVVRTKTRYSSAVEVPLERGQRFILSESYHTAQRTPGFRRSSQNFSEYLPKGEDGSCVGAFNVDRSACLALVCSLNGLIGIN